VHFDARVLSLPSSWGQPSFGMHPRRVLPLLLLRSQSSLMMLLCIVAVGGVRFYFGKMMKTRIASKHFFLHKYLTLQLQAARFKIYSFECQTARRRVLHLAVDHLHSHQHR
jgi:hypothetical protein